MPKAQLQYLTDELNKLREQKLYQRLRILETEQLPVSKFDGQEVINLSSNNYLGLATHPKLKKRALEAIEKYGVGSGAVRMVVAGSGKAKAQIGDLIVRAGPLIYPTKGGRLKPPGGFFPGFAYNRIE